MIRTTIRERVRWRVARLLDQLPGQCWADLVSWALHDQHDDPDFWSHWVPWRPIRRECRQDAARVGVCYCGKIGAQRCSPTNCHHDHTGEF